MTKSDILKDEMNRLINSSLVKTINAVLVIYSFSLVLSGLFDGVMEFNLLGYNFLSYCRYYSYFFEVVSTVILIIYYLRIYYKIEISIIFFTKIKKMLVSITLVKVFKNIYFLICTVFDSSLYEDQLKKLIGLSLITIIFTLLFSGLIFYFINISEFVIYTGDIKTHYTSLSVIINLLYFICIVLQLIQTKLYFELDMFPDLFFLICHLLFLLLFLLSYIYYSKYVKIYKKSLYII